MIRSTAFDAMLISCSIFFVVAVIKSRYCVCGRGEKSLVCSQWIQALGVWLWGI